jgi:cytochrome d ubiquinol oxidase subunit I
MSALDLARAQFGITTLYHFIFIPITLGLSVSVAAMETAYVRTGNPAWLRMTKFWGSLFLINVAMGVVTGIVLEFQFGMNWSQYSKYVGDIFGAPLALESLIAFFLESTFLGVWMFTWDSLSPRLHAAVIWIVGAGAWISAGFILAANAWMQHPVGYVVNKAAGRAELRDFGAVLANSTFLVAVAHTIVAGLLTAGAIMLGVGVWHLRRHTDDEVFSRTARVGVVLTLVGAVLTGFSGHAQAQIMYQQQPMKMASAEALWKGGNGAEFSLFAVGDVNQNRNYFNIALPHLLSVLATNTWDGYVAGINDVQADYQNRYGPGDYRPNIAVTYWSFRIMVGTAMLSGLVSFVGLLLWRRRRLAKSRWFARAALAAVALPFIGNSTGWIFTEMGRQPWAVFGLLRTSDSVSPSVDPLSVAATLVGFTAIYGVLAVITAVLMLRVIRKGVPEDHGGGAYDEPEPELAAV